MMIGRHRAESARLEEIRVALEMALLGAITIAIFIVATVLIVNSSTPIGPALLEGERFHGSYRADYGRDAGPPITRQR